MPDPDVHDVLAANRSFYETFNGRDFSAMSALWAKDAPVACTHPGWHTLIGRDAVLDSWRRLLSQAGAPRIAHRDPVAQVHGRCALVLCQELIAGTTLAATNGFVHEAGRWRMVLHQASQIANAAPWPDSPPTSAVH